MYSFDNLAMDTVRLSSNPAISKSSRPGGSKSGRKAQVLSSSAVEQSDFLFDETQTFVSSVYGSRPLWFVTPATIAEFGNASAVNRLYTSISYAANNRFPQYCDFPKNPGVGYFVDQHSREYRRANSNECKITGVRLAQTEVLFYVRIRSRRRGEFGGFEKNPPRDGDMLTLVACENEEHKTNWQVLQTMFKGKRKTGWAVLKESY